jgi:hypothetical protein
MKPLALTIVDDPESFEMIPPDTKVIFFDGLFAFLGAVAVFIEVSTFITYFSFSPCFESGFFYTIVHFCLLVFAMVTLLVYGITMNCDELNTFFKAFTKYEICLVFCLSLCTIAMYMFGTEMLHRELRRLWIIKTCL